MRVALTGDETACELASLVRSKRITAAESVEYWLSRFVQHNTTLNALREACADDARDAARRLDMRIAAGEDVGPLAGVPIAVKDNLATLEGCTACGSRMLEHYRSPFAATAVSRLTSAGAIVIGKANCDEFAMGSSSEHCAFGIVRNPHNLECVPGGSSGGSAAAVAAKLCPAALGTDTGGSIRQPASFCGVVGVKPTYGRVSRHGLVAFATSLDQAGPISRTVTDAALMVQVMAGVDRFDATSASRDVPDYLAAIDAPIDALRLGVPRDCTHAGNSPHVNQAISEAIDVYRSMGATIVDIDLPLTRYGIATYYVLSSAEASSNLARYDGMRYGKRASISAGASLSDLYALSRSESLGSEVQRRIMLGAYALSTGYYDAYYRRASQVRRLIADEYARAFADCHAIIGPVAPTQAFTIGERNNDPLAMYLGDAYTVNANVAGICAMSVPCPVSSSSLPIGLHIQCRAFDEATMFRIARMFEKATH